MGVTAIKRIHNDSPSWVTVNVWDGGARPEVQLAPGGNRRVSLKVDIWIPWANDENEFDEHSISVRLTAWRPEAPRPSSPFKDYGSWTYAIWQGRQNGVDDRVRYTKTFNPTSDFGLQMPSTLIPAIRFLASPHLMAIEHSKY